MPGMKTQRSVLLAGTISALLGFAGSPAERSEDDPRVVTAHAQVVATGIPGAGAIGQIGTFHLGGPFHDNPAPRSSRST